MDVIEQARRQLARMDHRPPSWGQWPPDWDTAPHGIAERFNSSPGPGTDIDTALRTLIQLAQTGDPTAPVALVAVLGDGLRSVARRIHWTPDPVGETVGDFIEVVYTFPTDRRRSLAANLLLDTRNRTLSRHRRDLRREHLTIANAVNVTATCSGVDEIEFGDLFASTSLAELVAPAGLTARDFETVVASRVWDVPLHELARRHGVTRWAIYKQRARAEARIAATVAAPGPQRMVG